MSDVVKRWVAGWDWHHNLVLEECEFLQSGAFLFSKDLPDCARQVLDLRERIDCGDTAVHATRDAAIDYLKCLATSRIKEGVTRVNSWKARLDELEKL